MNNLAIQILTHNNEKTIQKTLESLEVLDAELWVLDHNSTDKTVEIASNYARVIKISHRSSGRNAMIKEVTKDWIFYIEPYETITSGHTVIDKAVNENPQIYRIYLFQDDILTKPIRLWHKDFNMSFTNPVFETIIPEITAVNLNITLSSENIDQHDYYTHIINEWQKTSPTVASSYYYQAMIYLSKLQWDNFIRTAEQFLFLSNNMSMSIIMTRFYLSLAYYYKENFNESLKNLLVCLSIKPLMAEFWCLLADIHYSQHDLDKAFQFYDNALLLGSKRKAGDEWPVQLSKYGEYPKKMMEVVKTKTQHRYH